MDSLKILVGLLAGFFLASDTYDKVDMLNLKLNPAVAGVLAFSLAGLAPRLDRGSRGRKSKIF